MTDDEPLWRTLNRANWDERVAVHLGPGSDYHQNLTALRAGRGLLNALEETELGAVAGLRVLHLQCHFGADTLALVQRGAEVTGLDFSAPAIAAARHLADELGLSERARFVETDIYAARAALPEPGAFDLAFSSWGTICWLPDVREWARIVAWFLKPGARFWFADMHPVAYVLDDRNPGGEGRPGLHFPYFHGGTFDDEEPVDYADPSTPLRNARTHQFFHPLGDVVTALIDAGLRLEWLHEHEGVAWCAFKCLVEGPDRFWRWPDKPWLPLSYSLQAIRS